MASTQGLPVGSGRAGAGDTRTSSDGDAASSSAFYHSAVSSQDDLGQASSTSSIRTGKGKEKERNWGKQDSPSQSENLRRKLSRVNLEENQRQYDNPRPTMPGRDTAVQGEPAALKERDFAAEEAEGDRSKQAQAPRPIFSGSAIENSSSSPSAPSPARALPAERSGSAGPSSNTEGADEEADHPHSHHHRHRNVKSTRFDAAKQDYFSRHPNPDLAIRTDVRDQASQQSTEDSIESSNEGGGRMSDRAQQHANQYQYYQRQPHQQGAASVGGSAHDRRRDSGSEYSQSMLSPALSAGISIGATMGGQERIFPIKSVVAHGTNRNPSSYRTQPQAQASSSSPSNQSQALRRSTTSPPPASKPTAEQHPDEGWTQPHAGLLDLSPYGTDYTRSMPIPEESKSDFSFSERASNDASSRDRRTRYSAPSEPSSHATSSAKPSYQRADSSVTRGTDTSGPTTAPLTSISHPTTSRSSDDSDPTARKGEYSNSTGPSTIQSGHKSGRADTISSSAGASSLDPIDIDINYRARQGFERGEAEEGPSVGEDSLGSLRPHEEKDGIYLNVRFEHQETGDGHAILTGRKGQLLKCEDEPIHIPGAIQDYGVLIAVEEDSNGHLVVMQCSENSGTRLGLPPKYLFSLNCLTESLDEDQTDVLRDAIDNLDEANAESEEDERNVHGDLSQQVDPISTLAGSHNFQLSGAGVPGSGLDGNESRLDWTCWCAIHRPFPKTRPRLAVIEFELENDTENPISRERTQDEIDEDRAKEQKTSLFTEDVASDEIPGLGRGTGEVPRADVPVSSLPEQVGSGGENTSQHSSTSSSADASDVRRFTTNAKADDPENWGTEGLGQSATQDEILNSTRSRVKPIKALRRLRTGKSSGASVMRLFSVMGQINQELNKSEDLQTSLEITAGVVAEVTGFHRVMIYQFDESWNGQVVAELVDYKQTRDLYRGLHFPASDIPAQARELYKLNKVRLLYDRDQPTARLVCRSLKELETPLDLTHSHLRAMSPIHIKYLANMGVRASMSISIVAFGQLWGLISCHTYGRYGQRVSFPGRQLCRIIGDSVSRNIERLSYAQRLQSRKLINTIPTNANPGGYIIAKAEDLLGLFDAEFGVISIGDEAKLLGSIENSQEVLAVLEYLRMKKFQEMQISTNIVADFPDLDYPAGFQIVAGMLMVPLARAGQDFIAFFRRGQLQHVHWAGNPYDKVMRQTKHSKTLLEPRKSFKIWSETVMGKCKAWSDENIETASVLRLVYGKFIEVWRQREAAMTSSRLTTLLLSNASHEVRTPLNHIINYLEMALEGPLDEETRESLVRSHSASRALVHVINDLLDLTRTESGQPFFLQDPLDLRETLEEAVAIHRMEAKRNGLAFEIIENPSGTPQTLLGDRGKIRQIVANVTANAVKHTKEGKVTIEWGELPKEIEDPVEASPDTIKIGIAVIDTGVGIPEGQLEEMFRTFEQVDLASEEAPKESSGHLGLGLAVVARIVSGLGGQLRVESKVGHGSKFTFVLHFRLPVPEHDPRRASVSSVNADITHEQGVATQRTKKKAVQVQGPGSKSSKTTGSSLLSRKRSLNTEVSEIDSLVEAISSTPDNLRSQPAVAVATSSGERPNVPGQVNIEDSGTPLKSMKMEEEITTANPEAVVFARPSAGRRQTSSYQRRTSDIRDKERESNSAATASAPLHSTTSTSIPPMSPSGIATRSSPGRPLRIMIVEDDAINRTILYKKLTKDLAHEVAQTVHGEDAVRLYNDDPEFDIILMDLQMPICDGFTATKRIRDIESSRPGSKLPPHRHPAARQIPIFAVSASLHENQKQQLLDCGFSGFILKPVNFSRLQELMAGAFSLASREGNLYQAGRWEKGGWLPYAYTEPSSPASPTHPTASSA